ncbi:MAG: thioredoxin [Fretibacterium sp.]|nr:thioredoxin [Fretibacterium sp.]
MIHHFSEENFEAEVLKSGGPVLVDFYADWCAPCKMMGPVIEEIAEEYDGKAKVGKVDIEANMGLAAAFGVRSIPNFVFFRNGKAVDRVIGGVPKTELTDRLDRML